MKYFRFERVSKLIGKELNKIILKEVEFSGSLVTITTVEVSKDLDRAIVKASIIPTENSEEALKALNKNRPRLQYLLMKKINIKPMPQISFEIDYGPERAARVERALMEKN